MEFTETKDHNALSGFYKANGLEVSEDIETDGAVLSIVCENGGEPIAAATLSQRFGVFILDYIAVDPAARRQKLGSELLRLICEKAKEMSAGKLYLTARNPEFFRSFGFREGSPDGVDMNADCIGCPQFGHGCTKLPMYIEI